MSAKKLQQDCLPASEGTHRILIRATYNSHHIAHALACTWIHHENDADEARNITWITQLVVHTDHRERGIATRLLRLFTELKHVSIAPATSYYGILSSHPATIRAFLRAFSTGIENSTAALKTIKHHAAVILRSSPIEYVRTAQPRGTLFDADCTDGSVASAFTGFYVSHDDPRAAFERIKGEQGVLWEFGELDAGCEFLGMVEAVMESDQA